MLLIFGVLVSQIIVLESKNSFLYFFFVGINKCPLLYFILFLVIVLPISVCFFFCCSVFRFPLRMSLYSYRVLAQYLHFLIKSYKKLKATSFDNYYSLWIDWYKHLLPLYWYISKALVGANHQGFASTWQSFVV